VCYVITWKAQSTTLHALVSLVSYMKNAGIMIDEWDLFLNPLFNE